ncbi:bifunctional chorismate mutase/prephenate dehydrogenase [Microcoleus sp. FACHB-68]|uniref:bifunctional chorismate mutase/prephenate dehydrogenase n=1 Tax=Microcoleus sp. FACHB-68 TaxID=2692826 RepID=UPI0016856B52|nr:bifunctional chorismate mutase/prephenate dehydrogenase [Microcoleus sp. FACHB-68]MBD1940081.1 bifunctional chorismate mutase/prephenate dehydrogenase [Microcoleus sp. FACHB-68]
MTNNKLEQIDQNLIKLLKERISLLAESERPSLDEQLSQSKPLLVQEGVPEFVWENVITSCAAALATAPLSTANVTPRRVVVVGGRGMMGQFFTQQLTAAGHQVKSLGRNDWDQAENLLGDAEFVLVCVPIERTIEIIEQTAKYLSPTAVLADITSIKTPFVQAMLKYHSGPVVGLHPMFGPGVKSFLSQTVVACPGRGEEAFQWLLELIKSLGSNLIVCPAEEHDQMMIAVQAIRHFSTFSLGVFLAEEGVDITRSLEFSSPIYRLGINLVSRLFAQDASLYVDIMLATEERCEAIARLATTISRLANLVTEKDRDALLNQFEQVHSVYREEADRAMRESNHVLNALSAIIAAGEVEQGKY